MADESSPSLPWLFRDRPKVGTTDRVGRRQPVGFATVVGAFGGLPSTLVNQGRLKLSAGQRQSPRCGPCPRKRGGARSSLSLTPNGLGQVILPALHETGSALTPIDGILQDVVEPEQLPEIMEDILTQILRTKFILGESLADKKCLELDPFNVRMIRIKTAWTFLIFDHQFEAGLETLFKIFI